MPASREQDSPEVLARIHECLDLVQIVVKQVRRQLGPGVQLDELASYGHEGLLVAARSYDAARGVPFRRWANLRIRGAVIDGVRSNASLSRSAYRRLRALEASDAFQEAMQEETSSSLEPSAEAADAKLGSFLEGMAMAMAMSMFSKSGEEIERSPDPAARQEEELGRAQLYEALRSAVANRPEPERVLLEAYYFQEKTMEDAAAALGLSKSWASRLHARAVEGVAKELKRRKIEP